MERKRLFCKGMHTHHQHLMAEAPIEFFEDILRFVPKDDEPSPPPVIFEYSTEHSETLPGPEDLSQRDAEGIRGILNT